METLRLFVLTLSVFGAVSGDNLTVIKYVFMENWPVEKWINNGYFNVNYISEINVHWLRFAPPDPINFYVLGGLYSFIMVFGITGNFVVIFMFLRCKSLRTPANTLIVNLAVSDFFMMLKTPMFIYNCFYLGPALGDLACRIYAFVGGLTGTVTIITLSVISFDRYFVIKFPLNRSFSEFRVNMCLVIAWVYGLLFAAVPALDVGFGKYSYEGYLTSCSFDYLSDDPNVKHFILVFFVFAYLVPLSIISFSYSSILYVVIKRSVSGRDSFKHVKDEENRKQEIKLALVVLCTILLWFVSWTPYAVVALLGISDQKHLITPLVSTIPAMFCKTASCVNSYVYALSHPKFRNELRKVCSKRKKSAMNTNRKVWSTSFSRAEMTYDKEETSEDYIELETFNEGGGRPRREAEFKRQNTVEEIIYWKPAVNPVSSGIVWRPKEKESMMG